MDSEEIDFYALVAAGVIVILSYYSKYIDKQPCRTSKQTGHMFVMEILRGHWRRCQEQFRMEKEVLLSLCSDLRTKYNLKISREISTEEQVAIFLVVLGHGHSNGMLQERFQHSGEKISRQFSSVLKAVFALSLDIIKPPENFDIVPEHISKSDKYWPHFKDCIGAIDGTHVKAILPLHEQVPFIGRKGYPTQNVMAICDFDMCFTFAWPRWEGSAHDTRIFYEALRNPDLNFPHPKGEKYYLVDAGYLNIEGYLAPYKGERYHLPDFRRGEQPRNAQEKFNQAHSPLRSIIEQSFGVWKARRRILNDMHSFNFDVQVAIVCASMALHNYIRKKAKEDKVFSDCDRHPELVPTGDSNTGNVVHPRVAADEREMDEFRDQLAIQISASHGG